jgi:hypothetical protein
MLEQEICILVGVHVSNGYYLPITVTRAARTDELSAGLARAAHKPHCHRPVTVLEYDVFLTVTIEVASSSDAIVHVTKVARQEEASGCQIPSIHQPDSQEAIGILEQKIGFTIAIHITFSRGRRQYCHGEVRTGR